MDEKTVSSSAKKALEVHIRWISMIVNKILMRCLRGWKMHMRILRRVSMARFKQRMRTVTIEGLELHEHSDTSKATAQVENELNRPRQTIGLPAHLNEFVVYSAVTNSLGTKIPILVTDDIVKLRRKNVFTSMFLMRIKWTLLAFTLPSPISNLTMMAIQVVPESYAEVVQSEQWREAMGNEIAALDMDA
ncbi:UNVERIFIED_CONTAM: hypothetical protein Sindi_2239000 [Sesamum indicum]